MSNDIVEIPFNGSMMIAQKSDAGEIYAALKPICENIGIAYNGQWERLKRTPWGKRSYDTNSWTQTVNNVTWWQSAARR